MTNRLREGAISHNGVGDRERRRLFRGRSPDALLEAKGAAANPIAMIWVRELGVF